MLTFSRSRREGRSANGTMTFRRPSAAVTNQQHQTANDASTPASALPLVIESQSARLNLPPFDGSMRYSREQLLDIFQGTSAEAVDVADLFVSGWNSMQANGATRSWGKSSEGTVPQDPTVCWESGGSVQPIGLQAMTAEEKEVSLIQANTATSIVCIRLPDAFFLLAFDRLLLEAY